MLIVMMLGHHDFSWTVYVRHICVHCIFHYLF